jgi:hypothetical protein
MESVFSSFHRSTLLKLHSHPLSKRAKFLKHGQNSTFNYAGENDTTLTKCYKFLTLGGKKSGFQKEHTMKKKPPLQPSSEPIHTWKVNKNGKRQLIIICSESST